jgi:alkylhydroperoxidase family enzyme
MTNLSGLLETYLKGYHAFRQEAGFTAVEQEVVFLTISVLNERSYCSAAHSFIARKVSKVPAGVVVAIQSGTDLKDENLQALKNFTEVLFPKRGSLPGGCSAVLQAGYKEPQILGIILALAVKTLSNYSNHLFHTEIDAKFRSEPSL